MKFPQCLAVLDELPCGVKAGMHIGGQTHAGHDDGGVQSNDVCLSRSAFSAQDPLATGRRGGRLVSLERVGEGGIPSTGGR